MYIIAGLGNPGRKYENTRHNMGFITIDYLADKLGVQVKKLKFKGLIGETSLAGEKVLLVKPQTYMNLSGDCLREAADFYKVAADHILVIYDDMDLATGVLRIRKFGSAGTHNGMKSVVQQLGTDEFPRMRIGIGSRGEEGAIGHVLGGFTKEEVKPLEDAVRRAAEAAICLVGQGIEVAMNRYNGGPEEE